MPNEDKDQAKDPAQEAREVVEANVKVTEKAEQVNKDQPKP